MNWFYAIDGQQTGPVAFSEIERLHAEGKLTDDSLVWQQGQPNWVKLSTVLPAPAAPGAGELPPIAPVTPAVPVSQPSFEVVPAGKTNGLAITALVLGIVGVLTCCILLIGAAAAICGHLALNQIKADPTQTGRGMALAGVILGYTGVGLGILYWIWTIIAYQMGLVPQNLQ